MSRKDKIYAWLIGGGIALFGFMDTPTIIPLPALGMTISALAVATMLGDKEYRKRVSFGSPFVYIPVFIILASIVGSGIVQSIKEHNVWLLSGYIGLAVYVGCLFIGARILGREIFKPFAWAVVIETVTVLVFTLLIRYGVRNGGLASGLNYNIATGLLAFGAVVAIIEKQWVLVSVASLGMLLTGSEEALFIMAIMLVVTFVRRDISKKILLPLGLTVGIAVLGLFPFNYTRLLYDRIGERVNIAVNTPLSGIVDKSTADRLLDWRIVPVQKAIQEIAPLGHGYNYAGDPYKIPHNVPIVIMQQIGVIAALSWLFLTIYLLVTSQWKYAFSVVLVLSLIDNFLWTQVTPWWWALVGVASLSCPVDDYIFNRNDTVLKRMEYIKKSARAVICSSDRVINKFGISFK